MHLKVLLSGVCYFPFEDCSYGFPHLLWRTFYTMPPPLKNSVSKGFYIMPRHFRSQRQSCHYIHRNDLTTYIKKPLKRFPMLSGRNLRAEIVKALNSLSRFIRPTYVFIHPPHFLSGLHIKFLVLSDNDILPCIWISKNRIKIQASWAFELLWDNCSMEAL